MPKKVRRRAPTKETVEAPAPPEEPPAVEEAAAAPVVEEVMGEVAPPIPEPREILPIGQQARLTQDFKGPKGIIRSGTATTIEGHHVSEGKLQYKILHRGLRFWVPGDIVEALPRENLGG